MGDLPINGLDLAVLAVLLVSALIAFMRGFVHEVLSIGSWVGASLGALYGVPYAQPIARKFIAIEWAADAAAMVALFLILMLVLSLLTNALSKSVKTSALSGLDRSLGVLFGLARGAVILAIALLVTDWLIKREERPKWMADAKTLPFVQVASDELKGLMPASFMAAEKTAKDAAETAKGAIDAAATLNKLAQPTPAAPGGSGDAAAPTYNDADRSQLQRLLENPVLESAGLSQLRSMIDGGRLSPQQKQAAERFLNDPALQARAKAKAQELIGSGQMDAAKIAKAKELAAQKGIDPAMISQLESLVRGGNLDPSKLQDLQKLLDQAPAGAVPPQ
jgi:membrane protein required for colicin V production